MKWSSTIRLSLALVALGALAAWLARHQEDDLVGAGSAIDGDSIRVLGREIRLDGIDAPEFIQTCRRAGKDVQCGREARGALQAKLQRGLVVCRLVAKDRYRRDVGRCTIEGTDLNAAMVREGQAIALGGTYEFEENEARAARRGLWAGEFERPSEFRQAHPRSGR